MMSKSLKGKEGDEILPPDCWRSVFNYLKHGELQTASFACKSFLTHSDVLKENLKVTHPEINMLSEHVNRFKLLKKLDLTNFTGDLDEAIGVIADSSLNLETLYINSPCLEPLDVKAEASFKTASLSKLGSNPNMKNLKVLNCYQARRLDNNDLAVIAHSFPKLEELNMGHLNSPKLSVTDKGIELLASKLNLLKGITIYGRYSSISDRSIDALSLNCVCLKFVTILCQEATISESGIGFLLRRLPNLEALSIGYIKIIDSSVQSITIENSVSYAKALTCLSFSFMNISDTLLREIAKAKLQLKGLWLCNCNEFTVGGLLMVLSNYYLKRLRIEKASIADADMELLLNGNVGNLTHVEVSQCPVTDSTMFQLASKCPFLVDIKLNQTAIGEQVINNISRNYRVQNLYLANCSQINDASLQWFSLMFPNLRFIDLSFSIQQTSIGITFILRNCKLIRTLLLRGYKGANIFESDYLVVYLGNLNLEEMTLSDSCINGKGLAAIAKQCPRLVSLDLNECKAVGTEDIKQTVQNIKTLTNLHVSGCDSCDYGDLLEWMLSTGNLASLKKLYVGKACTKTFRDQFLHHGCLLL